MRCVARNESCAPKVPDVPKPDGEYWWSPPRRTMVHPDPLHGPFSGANYYTYLQLTYEFPRRNVKKSADKQAAGKYVCCSQHMMIKIRDRVCYLTSRSEKQDTREHEVQRKCPSISCGIQSGKHHAVLLYCKNSSLPQRLNVRGNLAASCCLPTE